MIKAVKVMVKAIKIMVKAIKVMVEAIMVMVKAIKGMSRHSNCDKILKVMAKTQGHQGHDQNCQGNHCRSCTNF